MSDMQQWLESLGLAQYTDAFERNDVDAEVLAELDHELLQQIGVSSVGHRVKIIKAAASFVPQEIDSELRNAAPSASEATSSPEPPREAERRQLTVMFCDLVDSVAIGERMELEDYRELLARFRTATTQAVASFNGFIARHQGDGLLVYFGYPRAQEDDAGRAVRAALDVVRAVGELASDLVVAQVRIGIATGAAIVGDVLATDASAQPELAAFGATPNLAARLQGQAQPNQVLVSEITQHLTREQFEYARTDLQLKGIEGEVFAYQLLSEMSAANRLDVTSGRQLTPLVGRQEELALLHRRWHQAVEGNGQVALICAEPGVGKTRMMMEAQRRFGEAEAETMLLFCSPYHSGTSLYPVADYLSRTLRFTHGAETVEQLAKLEHWVDSLGLPKPRFVPLIAPLLSVELPEQYAPINVDGAELRRRTNSALVELVIAHAARRPVLFVVEDLHWVDPTTLDFLGLLIESIRERRVLALITYRPEMLPPWSNQRHLTTLALNHLTGAECRQLLRGLNPEQVLSDDLVEQIVDRTDGVPLFVEELLSTVLEAGADSADAIPQTLRDALTARLDRLGEAKRLAQLASVIGRVFSLQLLQAASGLDPAGVQASLEQLLSSGLAYRRTLSGGDEFAFKHALIRDCAYQSLLRDERRGLHQKVANALANAGDSRLAPPELIARHFNDAGEPGQALPFWQHAGEDAEAHGAYSEALIHFNAALESVDEQVQPASDVLQLALGVARCQHFLGRRSEALAVLSAYTAAVDDDSDPQLAGRFFVFLGRIQAFEGLRDESLASLQRAVRAANRCGDTVTEGNAYAWLGRDHMFHTGRLDTANEYYEKAVQLLRAEGPSWDLGDAYFRFGMTLAFHINEFDRALATADELAIIAEQLNDDRLRSNSLATRGIALLYRGDWAAAEKALADAMAVAPNEYERVHVQGWIAMLYLETGDAKTALPLIEDELKGSGQYRSQEVRCNGINRLAIAHLLLGRAEDARTQAEHAQSLARESNYPAGDHQASQTLGLIARDEGDLRAAAALLRRALAIARAALGPLHTGSCQLDLASVSFDLGDIDSATEALASAHVDFVKCGARKYIERAHALATKQNVTL
ncbi:MAG: class 3 adenylate cyclase/tetratricopeptide (TPR) repeat protein [Gammaproteobacteria bacterium]|jgi:class 3 adenylate cyclase/tetratricopeptide (TPR) repeat protein